MLISYVAAHFFRVCSKIIELKLSLFLLTTASDASKDSLPTTAPVVMKFCKRQQRKSPKSSLKAQSFTQCDPSPLNVPH